MKYKNIIFLIIVIVLALLNISVAVLIKDARLSAQRNDFIEINNAKLEALNNFNAKLEQNVDDESVKMLYESLSLMEKLYIEDGNSKTNTEFKELIDIGWGLIENAQNGGSVSTDELRNKQTSWYASVVQTQKELENKIITYRFIKV